MSTIIIKNVNPGDIKKDVTILGVTGTFEGGSTTVNNQDITVDSSVSRQEFQAEAGYTGLGTVTVNPYVFDSKTVDSSTVSQTVTSDEDGMSSLTVNPYVLDSKSVNPSTNSQTITSDEDGLSSVTVGAVTAAIDSNITAGNIKSGVDILGVTGTFDGQGTDWVLEVKSGHNTTINRDTQNMATSDYGGLKYLFSDTALTSVTITDTSITGQNAFMETFNNCSNLNGLSFPRLLYCNGYKTPFYHIWNKSNNSAGYTFTVTPEFFKYSSSTPYEANTYIGTLNLVIPEDYEYLESWNNIGGTTHLDFNGSFICSGGLSNATVLDILQKLGSVSDYDQVNYTVNFDSKTINDNINFDYTLAKSKLTDAGWIVNGITIVEPELITITTGSTLNLYNDNTIGFDTLCPWTAAVNDPSIHLSSASGPAGSGQTITVTMDSGWDSSATITLSAISGTVTRTKTVNVKYSEISYTRLEYVEVPSNLPGFYLGSYIGTNTDIVFKHRALVSNGLTILGYIGTDGIEYNTQTFRYFYYLNTLYWDCAGRNTFTGNWKMNSSVRNYLFKLSDGEKKIINLDTQEVATGGRAYTWAGTNGPIGPNGPGPNDVGGENHLFYELTVYPDGYQNGSGIIGAHYIAVKDLNDVACIYDEVSENFYYPTSGSLIPGPELQS